MRCHGCYGSGKQMGGGMIQKKCDNCEGTGHIDIDAEESALSNVLRETKPEIIVKRSRKRLVKEV